MGDLSASHWKKIRAVITAVAQGNTQALAHMPGVGLPLHDDFWTTLRKYELEFGSAPEDLAKRSIVVPFADGRGWAVNVPMSLLGVTENLVWVVLEVLPQEDGDVFVGIQSSSGPAQAASEPYTPVLNEEELDLITTVVKAVAAHDKKALSRVPLRDDIPFEDLWDNITFYTAGGIDPVRDTLARIQCTSAEPLGCYWISACLKFNEDNECCARLIFTKPISGGRMVLDHVNSDIDP
jgi:hypothetical protein